MGPKQSSGYTGNILRVDLSRRNISVETTDEIFRRRYLGGAGFISYYLLKELEPGIDPLGPQNKLVFAAGPVTGVPLAGSGRHCVGAKSPRSGTLAKAESGGFWGAELKRAGFDAVIIEGEAKEPLYLWIQDGQAELRNARHLWGTKTKECQEQIRAELGDRLVRVASIGPAGENRVLFACIMNELKDAAARPGLGAVMGSKKLKAIAVRGHQSPSVADPARLKAMARWLADNYMQLARNFHEYGTGGVMERYATMGNLPIDNFRDGEFPPVSGINARALKASGLRVGMEGCYACPIRCKKVVKMDEPAVDPAYGGPEYETLAAFGSTCGVGDLKSICKANELCNAYGLDTISTGVTIAFAMECFQNGLLTGNDTDGLELTFGNAEALLRAVDLIGRRQGIGDLLAEGSAGAARRMGRGAERFAIQVKGVELPMHEPRLKPGMGLLYSVNAYGADHTVGVHDTDFSSPGPSLDGANTFGILEPIPLNDLGPRKVYLAKCLHQWHYLLDSLLLCSFVPYEYGQIVEIAGAVTGWNTSLLEAMRTGERAINIARAFSIREGLTPAHDQLPQRFFQPTTSGPLSKTSLDPAAMEKAKKTYYRMMGWDESTGVPKREKLEELEIAWVAEALARAGIAVP